MKRGKRTYKQLVEEIRASMIRLEDRMLEEASTRREWRETFDLFTSLRSQLSDVFLYITDLDFGEE